MDPVTRYHAAADAIVAFSGGSDKLVHMNAGMAIYLVAQIALRTRRGSIDALLAVVLLEAANEAMDRLHLGSWRWADTLGDIAATLFWPTMLMLSARWRRRRFAVEARARREMRELGALMGASRRLAPARPRRS